LIETAKLADPFAGRAATSMAHSVGPSRSGQRTENRQADLKEAFQVFAHRLINHVESNFAETHALQERLISSTLALQGAERMPSLAGQCRSPKRTEDGQPNVEETLHVLAHDVYSKWIHKNDHSRLTGTPASL
jgi:hypothetical protein